MADKTFKFKFKGDADDLNRATGSAGSAMESADSKIGAAGKRIAGAMVAAFAVDAILGFGRELYNIGVAAELWDNKAQVVFGDQLGMVQTWSDTTAGAMGLTSRELTGLTANMADLLVPMGMSREGAAQMSMDVTELSGALSAWSGGTRSAAEVQEILAKALLGERDALVSLGIKLSQAEVDTRALTLAREDGRDSITQLDQAMATQQLIMEKSTDAQNAWADGTFESTQKSNELKASIAELKEKLGTALLPVIQAVVAFIVDKVIPALQSFKEWIWPKIQAMHDAFKNWWNTNSPIIIGFLQSVWDKVVEMGEGFMDAWETDIKPAIDDLKTEVGLLWDEIKLNFDKVTVALTGQGISWTTVGQIVGKIVSYMVQAAVLFVRGVTIALKGVVTAIGWGITAWNAISSAMSSFKGKSQGVISYVSPAISAMGRVFTTVSNGIRSAMSIAGAGLSVFHGVVTRVYNALIALKNMFVAVKNALSARISIPTPNWPSPPSWLSNVSPFFHAGTHAVPGAPGADVPAILQAGETVLSVAQTRQRNRGGGGGGTTIVVNAYGTTGREMVAEIERAVRDGARSAWLQSAGVVG